MISSTCGKSAVTNREGRTCRSVAGSSPLAVSRNQQACICGVPEAVATKSSASRCSLRIDLAFPAKLSQDSQIVGRVRKLQKANCYFGTGNRVCCCLRQFCSCWRGEEEQHDQTSERKEEKGSVRLVLLPRLRSFA